MAYSLIFFAVAGAALFSRDFVKLKLGPLYALEMIFLSWLLAVALSGQEIDFKAYWSRFWAPILFFLWGSAWLFIDLFQAISQGKLILLPRVAQHALLFIYPLMWMTVGAWCVMHFPKTNRWIVYACLLTAWPNLAGHNVANISLGPVLVIVWLFALRDARKTSWLGLILLTAAACMPFWLMWLTSVQRTTFLMFALLLLMVPWVVRSRSNSSLPSFQIFGFALLIYAVGQGLVFTGSLLSQQLSFHYHAHSRIMRTADISTGAVSAVSAVPAVPGIPNVATVPEVQDASTPTSTEGSNPPVSILDHAVMAFQHGEDRPIHGNSRPLQMRSRRFMWKTALEDWKNRPIVGVGSIPEVPSQIRPGLANTYNGQEFHTPPIAGPHNSYLTVLARMGIVGVCLFAVILLQGLSKAWHTLGQVSISLMDLFLVFVPMNGLVYALFNSGFESPHNAFVLWLFVGMLIAQTGGSMQELNR